MAERRVVPADPTILRWVQGYVSEFEKRWERQTLLSGRDSWRVDETYIKTKGQWVYPFRAVGKVGRTIDFLLSKRRDRAAAVPSPGDPAARGAAGDHPGRVRRLASGRHQAESRRHFTGPGAGTILPVLEQHHPSTTIGG
jgi:hypothetical protein